MNLTRFVTSVTIQESAIQKISELAKKNRSDLLMLDVKPAGCKGHKIDMRLGTESDFDMKKYRQLQEEIDKSFSVLLTHRLDKVIEGDLDISIESSDDGVTNRFVVAHELSHKGRCGCGGSFQIPT